MLVLLSFFALLPVQESERLVATIPEGCDAWTVGFSADGKVAAYIAKQENQFRVVAGEWKSKPAPILLAALLPSGTEVVYATLGSGPAVLHRNDTVLFEIPDPNGWWFPGVVAPDGKTILNFKRDAKTEKSAVAVNGKLQTFHKGALSTPVLSTDGKHFAFALETGDGHCIVVDDTPGPTYDWVTPPALSADGKVIAYGAESDNGFLILHGDKKLPVEKMPKGVFLSPDGASLGWWGRADKADPKGGERVVVGGREGPAFETLRPPVFSPDGKHVAYRASKADRSWCVVVDQRTWEVGDIQVDPVFSADGKHVGFGLKKGRELWWKTLDVK